MAQTGRGEHKFPWLFFILAFGITWVIWLPGLLDAWGIFDLPVPFIVFFFIGTWGPFLAASIVIFRAEKWAGVKLFWKKGFSFPKTKGWLWPIIVIPLLLSGLPLGVYLLLGGTPPSWELLSQPWMIIPVFLTYFFTGGGNEEWGWRGYALDRLQSRWSSLNASLILGVIWGAWHLPLFFIEDTGQYHMSFLVFMLFAPGLSVLHTWVYNRTGRKLMAAWLFHAAVGTAWEVFPIVQPEIPAYRSLYVYDLGLGSVVALLVVLIVGVQLSAEKGDIEPAEK